MPSPRLSFWYRHAWWLPGTFTAFALTLGIGAWRPSEQSILLAAAILSALPWTLLLLFLDVSQGFADRGALVVWLGLCANVVLLWWSTVLLRERLRPRRHDAIDAVKA